MRRSLLLGVRAVAVEMKTKTNKPAKEQFLEAASCNQSLPKARYSTDSCCCCCVDFSVGMLFFLFFCFVFFCFSDCFFSPPKVWIDFKNIPRAVDFMESIRSGIRESNSFIYVISPDSVASKYCDAELEYAIQYGKRIIPLVIREVHPDKVRAEVQAVNWMFCCTTGVMAAAAAMPATPGGGRASIIGGPAIIPPSVLLHDVFPHLLESLLIDPSYVLMHTKLLVRAMEWEDAAEDPSFLATGRELEEANRWMARSQIYANQQRIEKEKRRKRMLHAREFAPPRSMLAVSNASALVSAPMPTRIQKLFLFASNERVAETAKKEQLLIKFLEEDEPTGMEDGEEGGEGLHANGHDGFEQHRDGSDQSDQENNDADADAAADPATMAAAAAGEKGQQHRRGSNGKEDNAASAMEQGRARTSTKYVSFASHAHTHSRCSDACTACFLAHAGDGSHFVVFAFFFFFFVCA